LEEIVQAIGMMVKGKEGWESVAGRLPAFEGKEE